MLQQVIMHSELTGVFLIIKYLRELKLKQLLINNTFWLFIFSILCSDYVAQKHIATFFWAKLDVFQLQNQALLN